MHENEAAENQLMDDYSEGLNAELQHDEGSPEGHLSGRELPSESHRDEELQQLIEDHSYFLSRLSMVSIYQFTGYGIEMGIIEYILRKATVLELLHLIIVAPFVEMGPLRRSIFRIPFTSPYVEIDLWSTWAMNRRRFRNFEHLWDF